MKKKSLIIASMILTFVLGLIFVNCSKISSIMEYNEMVAKDAENMTAFQTAMTELGSVEKPEDIKKIIEDKAIPAIKKSEDALKKADLPDEELKKIHQIIIDARTKVRESMEEYVKDLTKDNITEKTQNYMKSLTKINELETDYQKKLQAYYAEIGLTMQEDNSDSN